jgi:hypothetical protein
VCQGKRGLRSLECKIVKNANQGVELLFTRAETLADFVCNLCSNPRAKPHRAFGNPVEGDLLRNFGIQSLEYFCLKNWRKFILKRATRDGLGARARVLARLRTPRATSSRRILVAHARRGARKFSGPRPATSPLCTYG